MQRLFRQFSFPGGIPSHVGAGDPGLDPRGRRARLRALARLRRRDGQPRPARRRGRRRRRVRDRSAGHVLARQQVRRPGRTTARCCRSCTSTATRSPTRPSRPGSPARSSRACCAATATAVLTVEGDDPADVHRQLAAALDQAHDEIREIQRAAREDGDLERRPWPMILLVTPKGWTGPHERRRRPGRGHLAGPPGAAVRDPRERRPPPPARGVDAVLPARGALRRATARCVASLRALAPQRHAADERQPARERRPAAPTPGPARLPRARGRRHRPGRLGARAHPRARRSTSPT